MTDQLEMMPDEGKQCSPRLRWMKKHGITVREATEMEKACFSFTDDFVGQFIAFGGDFTPFLGSTEEDAISRLAENYGIPLWDEEGFAGGGK